uniref:RNA polymerase I largest subunit n=1 Tax=Panagrolaimus sp. ES5 TaxID=591445 RepID=A0AC34GEJ1_9BILA
KVRRPFLSALTKRSLLAPYNRFPNCNPSFVDITSLAFYALTQKNFFEFENVDYALALLEPLQRTIISELLHSVSFEEVSSCIQRMKPSDAEIINQSDCDEISETSSFGVCDDEEEEDEQQHDEAISSDSDYDIVNHSKPINDCEDDEVRTAIGKEDADEIFFLNKGDDLETAIDNDEFETQTAVEDDETKTAIEDDADEIRTAIDESDEVVTALEDDREELETAIGDDEFETETAIQDEDDETKTAIEDDSDEIQTAIGNDEDVEADDFHVCTGAENDFGLHIPNIDKVFKCQPSFHLTNATLNVEGNTLV